MDRVYNFSAGPSMLPEPVLEKAAQEMLNYQGSGMSVMGNEPPFKGLYFHYGKRRSTFAPVDAYPR
jgi:hypothetical protein